MATQNKDIFGNPVEQDDPDRSWNLKEMDTPEKKAERIEKRRARVAAKIAKEKGDQEHVSVASSLEFLAGLGGAPTKAKTKKTSTSGTGSELTDPLLEMQLSDSRKQLEQIILDGETLITNVKVASEYREKTRHERLDESKKERLARLHNEAKEAQEMYENINKNWLASAEKLLPMELYEKIQEQQKSCDDLLEKQDEEVYNLKKELEDQDIEYEDNLEMYQKDIMLMGDRIDDTVDTLRSAFMEELELIEQYTVRDREALLEENQKEWMNLLKEYEELEKKTLEDRKNDALGKFEQLTDLYGNVKQEARLLKNQMQHDMRTLFVEREQVKCAIQLNLEKLDYNLAVLRKREEENMKMKNSMKRLLLKLQDRFNDKAQSLHSTVAKGKRDSNQLVKEIRRLEALCQDAKRKTLHIYASDYHKFMDMWSMNEEECREKLCRLLGSERYIIQEQLGQEFLEPNLEPLDVRPEEVQCFQQKVSCCGTFAPAPEELPTPTETPRTTPPPASRVSRMTSKSTKLETEIETSYLPSTMPSLVPTRENLINERLKSRPSLMVEPNSEFDFCPGPEPDPEIQRRLMKHITKVICDQTGFLVEEKLRKIMNPFINAEKQLVHVDTVMQVLGITHIDEMQELSKYILRHSRIMKGIISKPDLGPEDPQEMMVSDEGVEDTSTLSMDKIKTLLSDKDSIEEELNRLAEVSRLSSTESEEGGAAMEPLTTSAKEIISDLAFAKIEGISEVHGVPLTEHTSEAHFGGDEDGSKVIVKSDSDPSLVQIIDEFSSEESLEKVLLQVERYAPVPRGEGEDEQTSSSCSCETIVESSSASEEKDAEDPFDSNKATVLSWMTEVAAGLTDCKQPQPVQEYYGEDGSEIFVEDGQDAKRASLAGTNDAGHLPVMADSSETSGESLEEHEFTKKQVTPEASCSNSKSGFESAISCSSTQVDSSEFFYIEPNDVLRALAAFCRDHNAKIKIDVPTTSELCDARIAKICFPTKESIREYWNQFIHILDPKSKILWEGIQEVFLEYNENLKIRNQYVEDIVKLYRQNYELSHLLKKHITRGIQNCAPKNKVGPFMPEEQPFCDDPCPPPKTLKNPYLSFPLCPVPVAVKQNPVQVQPQFPMEE